MAYAASPFYHAADADLGASIGQSLGRALFGDPDARLKQQETQQRIAYMTAEQAAAQANAAKTAEQTRGLTTQNDAAKGLPDVVSGMFTHQNVLNPVPLSVPDAGSFNASALPAGNVTAAPVDTGPSGAPFQASDIADAPTTSVVGYDPQTFRNGLPAFISTLAQVQGDKVDPNKLLGAISAYSGDDAMQRAGLIAQGNSPSKDFAGTPERADDIRSQEFGAELNKATTVQGMKDQVDIRGQNVASADRRRGQNIESGDRQRGQNIESGDRQRGQNLEHSDRIFGIQVKEGADVENPAGANVLARALGPTAVITSNARTPQEQRNVYATQHPGQKPIMDSAHLDAADGYPGFDIRPMPGMSFEQAKQRVAQQAANQGGYLRFAQDEGSHWHFDVRGAKSETTKDGTAAGTKPVSASMGAVLFGKEGTTGHIPGELDKQITARGLHPDGGTMANIRQAVTDRFQHNGGNAAEAVAAILDRAQSLAHYSKGGPAPAPAKAASAAPVANVNEERAKALAAINNGADRNQIAQLYKQRTGHSL